LEPELETTEFWQEQRQLEREEMRRQAIRWLTLFLVFAIFLSTVLWWSSSVVHYGAARAAGTVEPTYELTGFITDATTGRPISWATLADAQDEDRKPPFFQTGTGGEGGYRLLTLPEPHDIIIAAAGYRPVRLNIGTVWYKWRPISNEILNIRLQPE
jgi:hypothetical protein